MTQYSAGSFAQPLRRVLGPSLLGARESVEMPAPGDPAPARHARHRPRPGLGTASTCRSPPRSTRVATRLNALQFLTIRRYLSLVLPSLIVLLLRADAMELIADLIVQGVQMVLVVALAPAAGRAGAQGRSRG